MLSQHDVPQYLLDSGLLGPEAVVDGALVVRDASSRNRNYRAETTNGPSFLLKQGIGADTVTSIANEATVYERLSKDVDGIGQFLPHFYGYDPQHGLLILEFMRDSVDLRTMHISTGRFSPAPAGALGSALGLLHRQTLRPATATAEYAAFILSLHRPDTNLFRDVSAASLELVRIVQQAPGLPDTLDRVRSTWKPEALVHADVKWDNVLVSSEAEDRITLLDWEAASLGDPCWDVGSALSHYLSFWLFSIPVTGEVAPARFPELAGYPLDSMKPAMNALWREYLTAFGVSGAEAERRLIHSVELAGARLLQSAFEAAQLQQQVTSALVLHVQLAHNLLERAQEAATKLLGLAMR